MVAVGATRLRQLALHQGRPAQGAEPPQIAGLLLPVAVIESGRHLGQTAYICAAGPPSRDRAMPFYLVAVSDSPAPRAQSLAVAERGRGPGIPALNARTWPGAAGPLRSWHDAGTVVAFARLGTGNAATAPSGLPFTLTTVEFVEIGIFRLQVARGRPEPRVRVLNGITIRCQSPLNAIAADGHPDSTGCLLSDHQVPGNSSRKNWARRLLTLASICFAYSPIRGRSFRPKRAG